MENNYFSSVRNHFEFNTERSNVISGNYFFKYLHQYAPKEEKVNEEVYVIIEPNEITFKKERLVYTDYEKTELRSTELSDLLIIPKNTEHHNFLEIETHLIRLRKEDDEKENRSFERLLKHFIEDLYVNKYFLDCGDTQSLKSALEHIPLLQGIIYKYLFNYFYKACKKQMRKHWKVNYRREHFEDAYLNYSKFISQTQNERLFQRGGWFVKDNSAQKKHDLDAELLKVEKRYLKIEKKLRTENFIFSEPVNIKQILKRYGIVDVFKITLPKIIWLPLLFSLAFLIFFVLADILLFNLGFQEYGESLIKRINELEVLATSGLFLSALIFSVFTLMVGIILSFKYRLKVIPGIFLPRMVIAIISGWIVFFTAEELLKIDLDIDQWLLTLLLAVVFLVTVVFMIFEINNYAPAMGWTKILKRTLVVIALAFVVSYTFGFWTMSHVNKKFMSIDNFLVNESSFKKEYVQKMEEYNTSLYEISKKEDITKQKINNFQDYISKNINLKIIDSNKFEFINKDISRKNKRFILPREYKEETETFSIIIHKNSLDSFPDIRRTTNHFYNYRDNLLAFIKNFNEIRNVLDSGIIDSSLNNELNAGKQYIIRENTHFKLIVSPDYSIKIENNFKQKNLNDILRKEVNNLKSVNEYLLDYISKNPNIDINKKRIHAKSYNLKWLKGENHATFPNMLLSRSLLAMFIGIFLQLIIQDKTITEPI